MKDQNNTSLHSLLEQLPTLDLDAMLHSELKKELPAEDTVQLILKILREREADHPVVFNPQIDKAWSKYQKRISKYSISSNQHLKKVVAILILCCTLLFVLPQKTHAKSLLNRVVVWTESMFSLFIQWNQGQAAEEYVFQTDNPGLQTLYDAVTELGVTTPVVPMWIGDGYRLDSLDSSTSPAITKVMAIFVDNGKEAIFELNIYSNSIPREFHKSDAEAIPYENNGITYYLFRNNELWTLVWTRDNLECYIVIECQEKELYQILDSIYTMGD